MTGLIPSNACLGEPSVEWCCTCQARTVVSRPIITHQGVVGSLRHCEPCRLREAAMSAVSRPVPVEPCIGCGIPKRIDTECGASERCIERNRLWREQAQRFVTRSPSLADYDDRRPA